MSTYEDQIIAELNNISSPANITVDRLSRLVEYMKEQGIDARYRYVWVHPDAVPEVDRVGVLEWMENHAKTLDTDCQKFQLRQARDYREAWGMDDTVGWNVRHIRSIVAKPDSVPKRNRASVLAWLKHNPKSMPTIEETVYHINTLREAWGIE